jgi:hypothetical protein
MAITQDPLRNEQETVQLDDQNMIVLWFQEEDDAPGAGWYSSPTGTEQSDSPVWEMQKLGPYETRDADIAAAKKQFQENQQK